MAVFNKPIKKEPDGPFDPTEPASAFFNGTHPASSTKPDVAGAAEEEKEASASETQESALKEPVGSAWLLQEQLQAAQARADEYYDSWLRERANAENARRRAQEEVTKARKFAIEAFAENLLSVLDSLEAALTQQEPTLQSLREGVEMTLKQLNGAFARHQLTEIAPAAGEKFDPHQCHALSSVPSAQPANTVMQTLQKGYKIADRVLRPALVTVSSGQAED